MTPGQIGVIAVTDSATYTENLDVVIPAGDRLLLVAADRPAHRRRAVRALGSMSCRSPLGDSWPHLAGGIQVTGAGRYGCELLLDGMSVEGDLSVQPGDLGSLVISDSTLTAGRVTVSGNQHLAVQVLRSVLAGLTLPGVPSLSLADTLLYDRALAVDAPDARVDIQGCTLFGTSLARILTAGNSLFCGAADVRQVQDGCVRFSYLAPGKSRAPLWRYHCQPAARRLAADTVAPRFTSDQPGQPRVRPARAELPGRDHHRCRR